MKSTWLLVVGIAIGMLGTSAYLSMSNRSRFLDEKTSEAHSPGASTGRQSRRHKSLWPLLESKLEQQRSVASSPTSPPPAANAVPRSFPPDVDATGSSAPIPEPTRQELAVAAEQINQRATKKLDRLTRLLDLSEEQQDQVFPLLARSAPAYHPSLTIEVAGSAPGGRTKGQDSEPSAGGSADDGSNDDLESDGSLLANEAEGQIHDILTDDQQQLLEDEIIEEDLWWTEIIADLEDELDESTQIAAEPEPEPTDIGYDGNAGIGDLLQQAVEQNPAASSGETETAPEAPSTGRARSL
jgi:hypothetical protein